MSKGKQFKGLIECMDSSVYGLHIKVPEKLAKEMLEQSDRFEITLNESETWQAALLSMGNGIRYLLMSKARCKKHKLKLGDEVLVELKPDSSKYGIALPEEMKELLVQDIEGSKYFHELTLGKQRSLLHLIGKPKSSDLRLHKAIATLEYLKRVRGKLDFKELNEALKRK